MQPLSDEPGPRQRKEAEAEFDVVKTSYPCENTLATAVDILTARRDLKRSPISGTGTLLCRVWIGELRCISGSDKRKRLTSSLLIADFGDANDIEDSINIGEFEVRRARFESLRCGMTISK